ncbi:MAG: hypothetical protein GY731_12270, partial [Gammaproteobacteria bacterium]|nr:hypothetical protein [Gammaproteobacteria bacterium]
MLRYIRFHGKTHPKELGAQHVERFLSNLVTEGKVTVSTQSQALKRSRLARLQLFYCHRDRNRFIRSATIGSPSARASKRFTPELIDERSLWQ